MRLRRHTLQGHHESTHGIDLAPMLDFVLNLLIFFIITAVFVKELGLMVNRPSGTTVAGAGGVTSVPIHVLRNGEIWVDGRAVDVRSVRPNVERVYATNPKAGILIIAD
ncbi:MAG: ExbD/TolR family protein, partial [Candidatus Binatia bacterium]